MNLAPPYRSEQQGFTLLELMLVVLVMGLLVSTVQLSIPDQPDKQLKQLAARLQAQIHLAQQQAVFQNQDLALQFGVNQYAFNQFDGERWQPVEVDSKLAPMPIDPSLQLELAVGGETVDLTQSKSPQIIFLSDGQVSDFELQLTTTEQSNGLRLQSDLMGDTRISSLGAEP